MRNVGGTIGSDTVWDDTTEPYVVIRNVIIENGARLEIASGVEVNTDKSWLESIKIVVNNGTLLAVGARFTGETYIEVKPGQRAELTQNHTIAGSRIVFEAGSNGSVTDNQFATAMLQVFSASVGIDGNTFSTAEPIQTYPHLVPEFYDNTFRNEATIVVGGTIPTGKDVTWYPVQNLRTYRIPDWWNLSVAVGGTLRTLPGVILNTTKSWGKSVQIIVDGTFAASGTRFSGSTDLAVNSGGRLELTDDSVVAGERLVFLSGSHGIVTDVQFASAMLQVFSGSVTVDGNTFSIGEPIQTYPHLVPEFYDNTFQNEATIVVGGTIPTGKDVTWYPVQNLRTYRIPDWWNLSVPAGGILRTLPGVILNTTKSWGKSVQIIVDGILTASGTTFTGSTDLVVNAGGRLVLTSGTVIAGVRVDYRSGSAGLATCTTFAISLALHANADFVAVDSEKGDKAAAFGNTFLPSATVTANGPSTGEVDLRNQYWYTADAAEIEGRITHRLDNSNRPLVLYEPFQVSPPTGCTPPTISDITDQEINRGISTGAIPFTVGDKETPANDLVVTASSSNPILVPDGNITFGGSGANRTIAILPAESRWGETMITVTVSDGAAKSTDTFRLTVNDLPWVSSIADQITEEDTRTGTIGFTVGDSETPAAELIVTARSSNAVLLPNGNILLEGSGAARTITLSPAKDQSGDTIITISASDGMATTEKTFVLTVLPLNDAPTISGITDLVTNEDVATGAIGFAVGDVETAASLLTLAGNSSNAGLVPSGNIAFGGGGANRTVRITPAPEQFGTATITVTVSDGQLTTSTSFLLTVRPVNDPPTLDPILAPPAIHEDAGLQTLWLTGISAGGGESQPLHVTAFSDNPAVISHPTVNYSSPSATGWLSYAPEPDQFGEAVVTVMVRDAGLNGILGDADDGEVQGTFTVTVNPVNDPPTLDGIPDQEIDEDAGLQTLALTGISAGGGELQELQLIAFSSNPALIPRPTVNYNSPSATGSLSYAPAADQSGEAEITVVVRDAGLDGILGNGDDLTVAQRFTVTVNPVNDPPTISSIPDVRINENASAGPIPFTIGDVETAADDLVVTAESSNEELLPNQNINLEGSGGDRTITLTPESDKFGTTTVTVTVSDGEASQSVTFELTVNTPPTISAITDLTINENASSERIPFTIGDVETAAADLILTAESSNEELLPSQNISLEGSGENRTIALTPDRDQFGRTTITVTVSDGEVSQSVIFELTVNALPTIGAIADLTINENAAAGPIPFTIGDVETALADLILTVDSSNKELVPNENIKLEGTGGNRTITLTPEPDQFGTTAITVTISDGAASTSRAFELRVNAPPVSRDDDAVTTCVDTTLEIGWAALFENDTDDDSPESGWFISEVNAVTGGDVINRPETRTIVFTPNRGFRGAAQFDYLLTDGDGATDRALVTVQVVMPWQNQAHSLDVNGDGHTVPLDVLLIVNELNNRNYIDSTGRLPAERPANAAYYDVNGDGYATPGDALMIVNHLNRPAAAEGESRPFAPRFLPSDARSSALSNSPDSRQGESRAAIQTATDCDASLDPYPPEGGDAAPTGSPRKYSFRVVTQHGGRAGELEALLDALAADIAGQHGAGAQSRRPLVRA